MNKSTVEKIFSEVLSYNLQVEALQQKRDLLLDLMLQSKKFKNHRELETAYIAWQEKKRDI